MALKEDVTNDVSSIITQAWNTREGTVVPESNEVALSGGGVKLKATILYSDLAESTMLALGVDSRIAAKVAKAFMAICARVVRHHTGEIRSFDGDRIMAAFVGATKNTNAVKAALKINWCFLNVLKPRLEHVYASLKNEYHLAHCTGVDTGDILIVRGGIRNNNDLVWIGRAPNIAAKLSDFRNSPYHTYITGSVYDAMMDDAKINSDGRKMWEKRNWTNGPVTDIYRSEWSWVP